MIMDIGQRFDDEVLVGHVHSHSHHMKIPVVDANVLVDVTGNTFNKYVDLQHAMAT